MDAKQFLSALEALSKGCLSAEEQIRLAEQISKAMQEAEAKAPLAAFFQVVIESQLPDSAVSIAEEVRMRVQAGESVQMACQKVANLYKTSIFKVSKTYRAEFGEPLPEGDS